MWKKGEIVQLTLFPGGDLYFAAPLNNPKQEQTHIFSFQFRDLTDQEREAIKLGKPGEEISQETRQLTNY